MPPTKRKNKYEYLYVVQGNYGYGWDDLISTENYREAKARLKDYRENEKKYSHRMIHRREKA